MVYRILIRLQILYVILASTNVSVVGEQWEIGTWNPDALEVNNTTGNTPSISPSTTPTALVRESSILEGSIAYPSMEPSDSPSKSPSSTPSTSHAPSISFAPFSVTSVPSVSPSILPSITPTPQCHDHENYRSPLNSLNCTQHEGTDCFQWKHLGLTDLEVEDLINSCPISCDIECGSLIVFETNLSYRLLNVDNFLAPESTALFEDASANYLAKYVLAKIEDSQFSLNRVELLSQRMLEKVDSTRRLIRTLQASDKILVDLEINAAFRGFVLSIDISDIETFLREGIQTFGYMRALRFTNDPALQDVEVAENSGVNETEVTPTAALDGRKQNNSSPWIITVAILFGSAITVFVVVHFKLLRSNSSTQVEKDFDSPVISPAASARSNIIPTFSYESIVRFAPMNIGIRAETPTSMVNSTGDESSLKTSPNASMLSTTESGEEEHPLTGIVPSMIIYDCIDGSEELAQVQDAFSIKEKVKNVVPSRHMEATVSFRKALQENSIEALDKSMFTGIPETFSRMAIVNDQGHKKVELEKHLSESAATATSDASTVRTGAGERESLDMLDLSHTKEMPSRQIDITRVPPSHSFRTYHNQGRQIKIHAPRVDKLGLVLQSSDNHGHVVLQVKESSPMYGKIIMGDKLILIDGHDTAGMSLKKVTKLLNGSSEETTGMGGNLEIVVWRRLAGLVQVNGVEIPSIPKIKVSGHQRSVSGSSSRSATSAPPMGSYRSNDNYHRYTTPAHHSRKTSAKVIRDGHSQYYVSSYGSSRSTSSTPNIYHRHHGPPTLKSKMPPKHSHQRTLSRTGNSDTFINTHRRMNTPPLIPTSHSMSKTNEC